MAQAKLLLSKKAEQEANEMDCSISCTFYRSLAQTLNAWTADAKEPINPILFVQPESVEKNN